MKINRIHVNYANAAYNKSADVKKSMKTGEDGKDIEIEISKDAMEISKLIQDRGNEEFSQKVEEIRNAISSGTYSADSQKIAEKLLEALKGKGAK